MEADRNGIVNHETPESALSAVQRALQEAGEDGRWMAAIWSVQENRLRLLTRTTWQFPTGDVEEAVAQIRRSFAGEAQVLRVAPMEPLPVAEAFTRRPLFATRPEVADDDE